MVEPAHQDPPHTEEHHEPPPPPPPPKPKPKPPAKPDTTKIVNDLTHTISTPIQNIGINNGAMDDLDSLRFTSSSWKVG